MLRRSSVRAERVVPEFPASGRIHVCPLSQMPDMVDALGARHLVTIINPAMMPDTPPSLDATRHLRIACSDILQPIDGRTCPRREQVESLIAFVRDWNHRGSLLIHCLAGVSRSTAAAYIALCALNEDVPELDIARRLRHASPTATPNRLLVSFGDEALSRGGRMLEAIAAIGIGEGDGGEAIPFSLPSRLD
jgi:predicted protein tyrosine phosphatase